MQRLTVLDRDRLARKSHLYIPMELVYEAETWEVSIDDTCFDALHQQIHAQKKAYYLAKNQPPQDPS